MIFSQASLYDDACQQVHKRTWRHLSPVEGTWQCLSPAKGIWNHILTCGNMTLAFSGRGNVAPLFTKFWAGTWGHLSPDKGPGHEVTFHQVMGRDMRSPFTRLWAGTWGYLSPSKGPGHEVTFQQVRGRDMRSPFIRLWAGTWCHHSPG